MELLGLDDLPPVRGPGLVRHSSLRAGLGAAACLVLLVALALGLVAALPHLAAAPWTAALVLPPAGVLGVIVWLALEVTLLHFLSARAPTNRLVLFGEGELFVVLRSFLNQSGGDRDGCVLHLQSDEIRAYALRRESAARPFESERAGARRSFVELDLGDLPTHDVARALDREARRTGPERHLGFLKFRTHHSHRPVQLVAPGRLWIENASPALLRGLNRLGVPERAQGKAATRAA